MVESLVCACCVSCLLSPTELRSVIMCTDLERMVAFLLHIAHIRDCCAIQDGIQFQP